MKKTLTISLGVLIIFSIVLLISIGSKRQNQMGPTGLVSPTPIIIPTSTLAKNVSPLQKTTIGKNSSEELEKRSDLIEKKTLPNQQMQYTFTSPITIRPNEVITTANGVSMFERIVVPEYPTQEGYATIAEFKKLLGETNNVFKGSSFYGARVETYAYPRKGITFIGNPFTNEVYEIHLYPSTTIEEYRRLYGQDINEELQKVREE